MRLVKLGLEMDALMLDRLGLGKREEGGVIIRDVLQSHVIGLTQACDLPCRDPEPLDFML